MRPPPKNPFVSPSRPFDPLCHLTGDTFFLKAPFKPFFCHKTTSLVYVELNFLRHLERYSAAFAAKIAETTKNSPLPILIATFLVRLTIINIYLGVGNKMVRLGADFNRRRLLQIRNNRINFFFVSDFLRFRRRRTLNR